MHILTEKYLENYDRYGIVRQYYCNHVMELYICYRLACLHSTMAHSKDQDEGHAYFVFYKMSDTQ